MQSNMVYIAQQHNMLSLVHFLGLRNSSSIMVAIERLLFCNMCIRQKNIIITCWQWDLWRLCTSVSRHDRWSHDMSIHDILSFSYRKCKFVFEECDIRKILLHFRFIGLGSKMHFLIKTRDIPQLMFYIFMSISKWWGIWMARN